MALSKCAMESVMRSFSDRSRPARNSLRASSDEVVMAILPLFPAGADGAEAVAVLGSTCWQAEIAIALISTAHRNDLER